MSYIHLPLILAVGMVSACDQGPAEPLEGAEAPAGKADGAKGGDDALVRPLDSREYKVMLDASAFAGETPAEAVNALWKDLEDLAEATGRHGEGAPDDVREREVAFFDVPGSCRLRASGFALRRRVEDGDGEVTLKARSVDRLIAATTRFDPRGDDPEFKLEEDVVAPFTSKYSLSVTVEAKRDWTPKSLADLPDLVEADDLEDLEDPLVLVSDTVYQERVYKGAEIDLGDVDAKVTVTVWWLPDAPYDPVVAEASFKLKGANGGFERKHVLRANAIFAALQELDWVAPDATTKTAFVYSRAGDLCY